MQNCNSVNTTNICNTEIVVIDWVISIGKVGVINDEMKSIVN